MCVLIAKMLVLKQSQASRFGFRCHCYLCWSAVTHFNAQIGCLFSLLIWSHCVGCPVKLKSYCPLRTHVTSLSCPVLYVSLSAAQRFGLLHRLLWVFRLFSFERFTCWIADAAGHMAVIRSNIQQEDSRILRRSTLRLHLPCLSLSVIHGKLSRLPLETKNPRNYSSDQASGGSLNDLCRRSSLLSVRLEVLVPSLGLDVSWYCLNMAAETWLISAFKTL